MTAIYVYILSDGRIHGFDGPSPSLRVLSAPVQGPPTLPSFKVLAYADDLCVFLWNQDDLRAFQELVRLCRAIISTADISQWHGRTSDEPLKYLGYPIIHSHSQRQIFLSNLVARLKRSCYMHKCRNLSVRGCATVLNTLLLSKIWHVLRVNWIPKEILDKITSIGRQFVQHHQFPYISYNVLLQPTQRGGLGLLNPAIQQSLLAYRVAHAISVV
ncbi:uncharacterized protein RHIMIDRAFT_236576 [Rhizopus microsporus ATCC 52813]|uniref:Reverse transcriptase domain-containing protein n=1 Tax=Rhizopus microsporus ATCC 52813 TaxID=1340429 RepID=A0A2G4SXJ0_RHIZD|nr:uncharacterized protein RHIMIDRAFT_236576 [Rhizopus microsporus ATCC 52813]PHZ13518.1 hypothetical protein RHIMIDRAFT_236576 [Rhizopus microsporus ATCC 52813]